MDDIDQVYCINCSGRATTVLRPYAVERNGKLVVIREVPMLECASCGESYMTTEVMKRLDELLSELLTGSNDETIVRFPQAA